MAKVTPRALQKILDARKAPSPYAISEPKSIIAQYARDINKLVRKMAQLVKERVYPILDQYDVKVAQTASGQRGFMVNDDDRGLALDAAFAGIEAEFQTLSKYATQVAASRMMQANLANRRAFLASWSKTVGINVGPLLSPSVMVRGRLIDKDTAVPVMDAIRNNVELIKTVPSQHLAKIQATISKGIASGDDSFSLKKAIGEVNGQNTKRAKLIARDQLSKLNGVLVQARQQSLGVNGYIWRTSHDERVRDSHKDNDGKHFQWDSPPRSTGHPGEDIQCRCVAEPDLGQLIPSLAPGLQQLGPKRVNRISVGGLANVLPLKPKARPKRVTKKQRIEKAENEIAGNKFETGIAFDAKGNEVFRKKGGKHQVAFSASESEKIKGTTFTHNHPSGSNFSPDDLDFFDSLDLKEIRAVSEDFVYSLSRMPGARAPNPGEYKKATSAMYRGVKEDAQTWARMQKNKGIAISDKEYNDKFDDFSHTAIEDLAKRKGLKYKRTKRKAGK
jgi:SPP1 gp7 family putative phage head morphogenesis protein